MMMPCQTKILRICSFRVPRDFRIAMSFVFSMTIMTNEIRILRAATNMIIPMMRAVTSFSVSSALNSTRLRSSQVLVL